MKVFLTHHDAVFADYFGERALAALEAHASVVRNGTGSVLSGAELARAAAECQAIIAHRATPGEAATFAGAPDLQAFLRCAVDVSTIDIAAASRAGVLVTRATPGFTQAVAELGLGLMIDLARGTSSMAGEYRDGLSALPRPGRELGHSTLGLVGYGRIAMRLSQMARAIGMRVLAHDPYHPPAEGSAQPASFEEVLRQADFVVCLAASVPETADLMNAAAFARMKPGSFFVNLARGELVDEAALVAALDGRHLAGAALDVGWATDQMPSPALARHPNVIATPHVGGMTRDATEHQAMDTVRQVAALAAGIVPDGTVNLGEAGKVAHLRPAP